VPGDRLADAVHRGAYASAVDGVLINTHEQFATQFSAAKEDIGQVQILLSDAITQLVGSFDGMHNLIREQHEVILALAGFHRGTEQADVLETNPEESSKTGVELSEKMEEVLGAAVISLQFQDMLFQLLQHSVARIEFMQSAWERMGDIAKQEKTGTPVSAQEVAQVLHEIVLVFERAEHLNVRNPVRQKHLKSGDIELF
jgi:hypothetical protein